MIIIMVEPKKKIKLNFLLNNYNKIGTPKKKKKKKKQLGVEEGGVGEGSLLHKF